MNEIGLEFGIWFEPEMISPDSDLYREHPEWAIQIPGREATEIRCQYVLDLSRPEVQDYAYECVAKILRSANIKYVKWDMNRQLSDLGSTYLDKDSQQELSTATCSVCMRCRSVWYRSSRICFWRTAPAACTFRSWNALLQPADLVLRRHRCD